MLVLLLVLTVFVIRGGWLRVVIDPLFKKNSPQSLSLFDELNFAALYVLSFRHLWLLYLVEPYVVCVLVSFWNSSGTFVTSLDINSYSEEIPRGCASREICWCLQAGLAQLQLPDYPTPESITSSSIDIKSAVGYTDLSPWHKQVSASVVHPADEAGSCASFTPALQVEHYVPTTYNDHIFDGKQWDPEKCGSRYLRYPHPRALLLDELGRDVWTNNLHLMDMSRFDFSKRAYITPQLHNMRPVDSFQQPYHIYLPDAPATRIPIPKPIDSSVRSEPWPSSWVSALSVKDKYLLDLQNYNQSLTNMSHQLRYCDMTPLIISPTDNIWHKGFNRNLYGLFDITMPVMYQYALTPPAWYSEAPQLVQGQAPQLVDAQAPQLVQGQAPQLVQGQAPQLVQGQAPQLVQQGQAPQLVDAQVPEHAGAIRRPLRFGDNWVPGIEPAPRPRPPVGIYLLPDPLPQNPAVQHSETPVNNSLSLSVQVPAWYAQVDSEWSPMGVETPKGWQSSNARDGDNVSPEHKNSP